jgi:hypothetical protein
MESCNHPRELEFDSTLFCDWDRLGRFRDVSIDGFRSDRVDRSKRSGICGGLKWDKCVAEVGVFFAFGILISSENIDGLDIS